MVSLFTKVPEDDALKLLAEQFLPETITLFHLVMMITYFSYGGKFYEMMNGMAMDSPLSLATANFFMEHLEEMCIKFSSSSFICVFCYADIFMVCSHGMELSNATWNT